MRQICASSQLQCGVAGSRRLTPSTAQPHAQATAANIELEIAGYMNMYVASELGLVESECADRDGTATGTRGRSREEGGIGRENGMLFVAFRRAL